ncbi:MAG: sulfotransferase [Myxococcota bacterium]
MSNAPPIFIGGLMKSGTSLLRKLLGRHPRIFAGLETHWFADDLWVSFKDVETKRAVWVREFYGVAEEDHRRLALEATSAPDFLHRFLGHCAAAEGKPRWLEKTPDNIFHLDRIWESWAGSQVFHVVRDPRDVWASWKRNQKSDLPTFLAKAQGALAAAEAHLGTQSERYAEVRYEALVREPAETLRAACAFLQEDYDDGLADYAGDRADYEKVLKVTGKRSATAESLQKPIFQSSVGSWAESLGASEAQRIQEALPTYGALWGYW